jgi:hypothetical protein
MFWGKEWVGMGVAKVVEWVDIEAPLPDVFHLVTNIKRRIQLSPLWGIIDIDCISDEFPQEGSQFRTRLAQDDVRMFDWAVTSYRDGAKLGYQQSGADTSRVTWVVQKCSKGTRLIYEEEFQVEDGQEDEILKTAQETVKKWLKNIQRYSELHKTRAQRTVKWLLDRYFLKLNKDQRNVIVTLLFVKGVSIVAFAMAAIAYGISTLF